VCKGQCLSGLGSECRLFGLRFHGFDSVSCFFGSYFGLVGSGFMVQVSLFTVQCLVFCVYISFFSLQGSWGRGRVGGLQCSVFIDQGLGFISVR
jgi:hypothetical protein